MTTTTKFASKGPLYAVSLPARKDPVSKPIQPKPLMTSHGPAYPVAHYVCPECGNVEKLPSSGKPEDRPYCFHGEDYSWHPVGENSVQMEYAEVRVGKPHSNEEAWDDPKFAKEVAS